MTSKGKFITVEGGEGAGKSTNLAFIKTWLNDHDIDVLVTREPGGTPLAEDIRELLLAKRNETFDQTAELLLMFAARSQHLQEKILPALESSRWVLCDRFTDATYAYQGGGRGVSKDKIAELESLVQGDVRPSLTFILDLPVETGLQRVRQRGELDRFESEKMDFFKAVRDVYLQRAKGNLQYAIIDASQDLENVQQQIAGHLSRLIQEQI